MNARMPFQAMAHLFVFVDVIGLYLNPPDKALV
jgi:hypothetical protein